jgi:hypothetical protein
MPARAMVPPLVAGIVATLVMALGPSAAQAAGGIPVVVLEEDLPQGLYPGPCSRSG